jgi:hypothetical protein
VAGLLGDRSYVAGLRQLREVPLPALQPVVAPRPVATVSARPAA